MKNVLRMNYPASWWRSKWRDALPAGNGKIGASVYGGIYEETVLLSHEDLWWQSRTPEMPDVSDKVQEVRKLLLEGKAKESERILANTLKERGYNPKIASPLPLGDLKVIMPGKKAFKNYSRSLDMETGEITVQWLDGETAYHRSLFVSRTDDLVVCEIGAHGPDRIQATISLDLHDLSNLRNPQALDNFPIKENAETLSEGGFIYYAAKNEDGTDFGAVARVTADIGVMESDGRRIKVQGATHAVVCIKVFVKGERKSAWSRLASELSGVSLEYGPLFDSHKAEHSRIFNAMSFDIGAAGRDRSNEELLMEAYRGQAPDALVEKMWAFGRYLLISSTRKNGQPCHLYGLWCGDYDGMWAFHMVNENLQMIYWQALSGNMPELLLAVFDYCERLMEDFRTNAKKLYGCRGIYIPAPTTPDSGLLKHLAPHIIHWTGGAGWVAQHYYDYYLHTGDVEFLKQRALPYLRETALFYEDFFIVGEDGYYVSCPSNSPENTPGNYRVVNGMNADMTTTVNATMDFAIAKEVLSNLIEGVEIAGIYEDEVQKWKEMLAHIPPYQLNEDGAVREWMHPYFTDNYHHRHQSHIYPLFPGIEIARKEDPELFEAFVTALKKRLVIGLKEQTGWSMAHMSNSYARMGEGDLALECLDILSRCSVLNNFFTLHNDWRNMGIGVDSPWAPFQIDANMGWTSAIQEMLLFSLPGKIHILPALPARWKRGKAGPMLARGGVEVTLKWDQELGKVEVLLVAPKVGQSVDIVVPGNREEKKVQSVQLEAGVPVELVFSI